MKLSSTNDFSLNLIEIYRLRSLLKIYQNNHTNHNDEMINKQESLQLINKTITLASDKNLPIEKQMKVLLAVGIINRELKNTNEA